MTVKDRGYPDFQDHLKTLHARGLLRTVDTPINKDTEMHPLVRWQFRGGVPESKRSAFLFTNIRDSKFKTYKMPVVVGALAATPEIYSVGMGVPVEKIGDQWTYAIANPIDPIEVGEGPCQEVILTGNDLVGPGKGLETLPVPILSPGWDSAPYFTATGVITKDPETGVQNMGAYRGGLKAPNRLGVQMSSRAGGSEGYLHWLKYQKRGDKMMACAFVVGAPPPVVFVGPQKMPIGIDKMTIAGALMGAPVRMVKAKTVDLMVPADAELVIEGLIDTKLLEPEGPFGESHGHIALEGFNMSMEVTAITHKANAIMPSIISQVTPSESSVIKRVAYEPMYLNYMRNNLSLKCVKKVSLHEPLTNISQVIFVQLEKGTPQTEVWRALNGASFLHADSGKYVIAIDQDIDPDNADSVFWAMVNRANPIEDMQIIPHRKRGHGLKTKHIGGEAATLLIDATMKGDMSPLALPKKEYMEHAKEIWERLKLPKLTPQSPWHGYELGNWSDDWDEASVRAVQGFYHVNGEKTYARRKPGLKPETPVWEVEEYNDGNQQL